MTLLALFSFFLRGSLKWPWWIPGAADKGRRMARGDDEESRKKRCERVMMEKKKSAAM